MSIVSKFSAEDLRELGLDAQIGQIYGWRVRFAKRHEATPLYIEIVQFDWPVVNGLANELPVDLRPPAGGDAAVWHAVVLEHIPGQGKPYSDAETERRLLAQINANPAMQLTNRFATRFIVRTPVNP